MKVLRKTAAQDGAKGSTAAAAGAKAGANKVTGTTATSNGTASRPGIKIVSRAAAPPAPVYSGPTPEQIESRKVAQLLQRLAQTAVPAAGSSSTPEDAAAVFDGQNDIDAAVGVAGFGFLQSSGLLQQLPAELDNQGDADAREAALLAVKQLCQAVGRESEPYVVPLLPLLLERMADRAQGVRQAAGAAAEALAAVLCPAAVELVLPGGGWQKEDRGWCLGMASRGVGLKGGGVRVHTWVALLCPVSHGSCSCS